MNKVLNPPMISTRLLKQIYATMLHTMSNSDILEFFHHNSPAASLKNADIKTKIRYIWQKNEFIELSYFSHFADKLQRFLCLKKYDGRSYYKYNYLIATLAGFLSQFVSKLYIAKDPRQFVATTFIEFGHKTLFKNTIHKYFCCGYKENYFHGYSVLIHDLSFSNTMPQFDLRFLMLQRIKEIPLILGFPAFEHVELVAEENSMEHRLNTTLKRDKDNRIVLGHKVIGEDISIHQFMDDSSFNYKEMDIPDFKVQIALEDVVDSDGNKLMTKGNIYNSRLNIFYYRYKAEKDLEIKRVSHENVIDWKQIEKRHERLLLLSEIDSSSLIKVYYCDLKREISYNHKVLTKGIQAEMLRHILEQYSKQKRNTFYFREFCNESIIPFVQSTSSFVNRFNRICAILQKNCPEIELLKTGKGEFRVHCSNKIKLVFNQTAELN